MVLYTVRKVVKYESDDTVAVATTKRAAIRLAKEFVSFDEIEPGPSDERFEEEGPGPGEVYRLQSFRCDDTRIVVHKIKANELFKPCSTFFPSPS